MQRIYPAQLSAESGYNVVVSDYNQEGLDAGLGAIHKSLKFLAGRKARGEPHTIDPRHPHHPPPPHTPPVACMRPARSHLRALSDRAVLSTGGQGGDGAG